MNLFTRRWPADATTDRDTLIQEASPRRELRDARWDVVEDFDGTWLVVTAELGDPLCRKRLHPLVGDNALPMAGSKNKRCRKCKNDSDKASAARRRGRVRVRVEPKVRLPHPFPAANLEPYLARLSRDERGLLRQATVGGGLTDEMADKFACRLGLHPCLIWPEWWERAGMEAA